jgi:hypothetical protein
MGGESGVGKSGGQLKLAECVGWGATHDLKLDGLALEVDGADLEVDLDVSSYQARATHANGRDVALGVGVVGEAEEQARLADTRVADKEKLCDASACRLCRSGAARGVRARLRDRRAACRGGHRAHPEGAYLEEVVVLGSRGHGGYSSVARPADIGDGDGDGGRRCGRRRWASLGARCACGCEGWMMTGACGVNDALGGENDMRGAAARVARWARGMGEERWVGMVAGHGCGSVREVRGDEARGGARKRGRLARANVSAWVLGKVMTKRQGGARQTYGLSGVWCEGVDENLVGRSGG